MIYCSEAKITNVLLQPCMNQALGKLEVCCKGPPTAAQVATTPRATPPPPPPVTTTGSKSSIRMFVITEKAPTRAFS